MRAISRSTGTAVFAVALTLVLTACGDDDSGSTGGEPTSTTPAATTAVTDSTTAATEQIAEDAGQPQRDASEADREPTAAATAEDAIRAVLTADGDSEQACTAYVTDDFIATAYGGRANCIAARRPNALAESLRITDAGEGRFTVVPRGGPYDGVEVQVEVVDDGGYRVSSLVADVPAGP